MLFCFELTVASLVRSGYFASLYFWIDLAATLSMLLDITRLMDLIFRQSTMAGSPALTREPQNDVWHFLLQTCCGGHAQLSTVKRCAGLHLRSRQAFKLSSRVAAALQAYVRLRQILRVTRIFRLMRVLKLFQQYLVWTSMCYKI